jgi:hypothetical protein
MPKTTRKNSNFSSFDDANDTFHPLSSTLSWRTSALVEWANPYISFNSYHPSSTGLVHGSCGTQGDTTLIKGPFSIVAERARGPWPPTPKKKNLKDISNMYAKFLNVTQSVSMIGVPHQAPPLDLIQKTWKNIDISQEKYYCNNKLNNLCIW